MEITIKTSEDVNEYNLQKIVSYAIVLGYKVNLIGPEYEWTKRHIKTGKMSVQQN